MALGLYLTAAMVLNMCGVPHPLVPPMAGRLLRLSTVGTALFTSSGFYLYNRPVDINDISLVRFGRAAATVSILDLL